MSSAARITRPPKPVIAPSVSQATLPGTLRRFTVAEYHTMGEVGVIPSGARCELIHGLILEKPVVNPPHASTISKLVRRLFPITIDAGMLRIQLPITLEGSEPEPDLALAVGTEAEFTTRHPGPVDLALVIEVSDTSLRLDQTTKRALYAAAKIAEYWIVNLEERHIEVYTRPRGGKNPTYRTRTDYTHADRVPVMLNGTLLGTVSVAEVLP